MSSAAVQQNTSQQYSQGASGRDRYPANASVTLSSSPPSSRRAARQNSSGNGMLPNTPQQAQFSSAPGSASTKSPRGTGMPSAGSPGDAMNQSTYSQFYPDQTSSNVALPVRTSTAQASQSTPTTPYDDRGYSSSSRTPQQYTGYESGAERDRGSDGERRRQQTTSPQEPTSARSQRSRPTPTTSRSATHVGQLPIDASLPRENSAIINHIVVDDPQSDIARERARIAESRPGGSTSTPVKAGLAVVGSDGVPDSQRAAAPPAQRSRQEHLKQSSQQGAHRKEVKFGDYILGQTLGEGEFGKVKMGWKKDSTVQVAIKLIRKESLAGNTTRLPKIYREISILRELQHPNIVRLHEFVETERHMGIILEYASGGELFDYILNHRYLKDPAARRLFAQLVSGVGYLHKKGIVHRDLKLENLLLDRNRNIIITDFGFANTFSPTDELGEEIERRITDKEFMISQGLDVVGKDGHRRGDLMQTSCGSPCYAAPELVVSDGLYTGRKVDVWSCGVILYAMLAGYLPFDDDPANPEGDNINLLYKYIVSTPLTFPEYVTPHARDLLRRILVPDPRRRADLFEVARHSWLSEYSHVVGFIGSSTKSDRDIVTSALRQEEQLVMGRSASVREPTGRSPAPRSAGTTQKAPTTAGGDETHDARNPQRDTKRRTVQVEYVPPNASASAAARGETNPITAQTPVASPSSARTRARAETSGPVEVSSNAAREPQQIARKDVAGQSMPPPGRQNRTASDSVTFAGQPSTSVSRPNTGGTLGGNARLPSRGNSYSQPAAATPTNTNVQGHFSQPKSSTGYIISSPISSEQGSETNRPASQHNLAQFQQHQQLGPQGMSSRGHKRSSTLGSIGDRILGRSNSRRNSKQAESGTVASGSEKRDRKYPPLSMKNAIPQADTSQPRPSSESRRSSFGFSRKNSEVPSERRTSRRFSFLPNNFSMNSFSGKKDQSYDPVRGQFQQPGARPPSKGMAFGRGESPAPSQSTSNSNMPGHYDPDQASRTNHRSGMPPSASHLDKALPAQPGQSPPPIHRKQYRDDGYGGNALEPDTGIDPPERFYTPAENADQRYPRAGQSQGNPSGPSSEQYNSYMSTDGYANESSIDPTRQGVQNIRGQQRKFDDAYEQGHAGSSSGARRVMDFFRRRGKDRTQD
nr:serine/threonine-protein kinase kin4 [Quercus suber]